VMKLDSVTFGMGCFWEHEARFGYHSGIIRTRVGFAGGKEGQPTTKNTLYYTEVLQVQFNPELLSLEQIVNQFFKQHNTTGAPSSKNKNQGKSITRCLIYIFLNFYIFASNRPYKFDCCFLE
jgi:peptide methionine sulfoxide reductase MsrA